jgi:putative chitinase
MLLKIGSIGDDVKKLQLRLGLISDGKFGPNTELKVREFQLQSGLTPDGIVGDITWNKLFPQLSVDINKLRNVLSDKVMNELSLTMIKFNINTILRLSHFLSQCAQESGNFNFVSENLNYSANGLLKTFPSYFNQNNVNEYVYQPQKIANKVYDGRLGNVGPNDGWLYRGRGYIQLTGHDNYKKFETFINEDLLNNPDLVATKYPLTSAGWFFYKNGILAICDLGSSVDVIKQVTKRVNGGYNGLDGRINYFNRFWNSLQ